MAYINGLRSFGHNSELAAKRLKSKKRESTGKWLDALVRAERAHWLCRKAAELAREGKLEEAEESATRSINELTERSVST
jgi:ribose 1,5-bisphosphokinase PhnN